MSAPRRLQSRTQASSPAVSRSHQSDGYEPIPFPDYEPPTCPLSVDAQRAITAIRSSQNSAKIKQHIGKAIINVTATTIENNDRLWARNEAVEKNTKKREKRQIPDEEKPPEHAELERYRKQFDKKVTVWREQAEIAMRQLIDQGDILAAQDGILEEVATKLSDASAANARAAARVNRNEDQDEAEEGAQQNEQHEEIILSAVELLMQAKEDYTMKYEANTMTKRYAQNNDYRSFKRQVHDSLHPYEGAPPLERESAWFPEDSKRRRLGNSTDNTNNGGDSSSDDEVEIQRVVKDLKCPLTFATFREPYTNLTCNHSFEKEAIIEYHRGNSRLTNGVRVVKCPAMGCDNMINLADMIDDQVLLRQVNRERQKLFRSNEDDDDDDMPRGTQRNRPQSIDEEDSFMDVESRRKSTKRER